MKGHIFKKLFGFFTFAVMPLVCMSIADNNMKAIGTEISAKSKIGSGSDNVQDITGTTTDPKQYVGYGFNVTGQKALYEPDALMLNNPILDTTNPQIQNAIKVFDGSKTEYVSTSKTSAKEIAEEYGKTIGAGLGGGGKIAMVNIDVNAKFNMGATSSWGKISNEEFSYYTIFAGNRPVVLQMEFNDLVNYLTPEFKRDLNSVNSNLAAENLYKKYGTHLLTGYTMGGIFEMTNYYATNSDTYVKESEIGFSAQVNAGLSSLANGNLDFSFNNKYGYKDNNRHAINQYKCTTYGGLTFPGLTIDQAFSWYETLAGAGFVYQLWTDSINAGKNLVIVDIPQSSKMIPLWDLLPLDENYNTTSKYLRDTFRKLSASAYEKFDNKYPSHFKTGLGNEANFRDDLFFEDRGFELLNFVGKDKEDKRHIKSLIDAESVPADTEYDVKPGSRISMLYDTSLFATEHVEWSITQVPTAVPELGIVEPVTMIDKNYGVFEVKNIDDKSLPLKFSVTFTANGQDLFTRKFNITSSNNFCGGSGSESSPYLISNAEEYYYFADKQEFWAKDVHVKLIADIDLDAYFGNFTHPYPNIIGKTSSSAAVPYEGVFDGGYHIIKKPFVFNKVTNNFNDAYYASSLFVINNGIIKNLTVDYSAGYNFYKKGQSMISGIATENNGLIENCTVKDFQIYYNNTGSDDAYVNNKSDSQTSGKTEMYIGGIASLSTGTIRKCVVNNMDVYVKVKADNTTGHKLDNVYIGGITGYSYCKDKGPSRIEACETNSFSSYFDGSKNSMDKFEVFQSPFIASAYTTNVSHALVKDLDLGYKDLVKEVDLKDTLADSQYSISYNYSTSKEKKSFIGGLFGNIARGSNSKDINIDNAVLLIGNQTSPTIKGLATSNNENQNDCGALIGRDHKESSSKINISKVYFTEPSEPTYNVISNKKISDSSISKEDIASGPAFTRYQYASTISNNEETWKFYKNDPSICLLQIRKDSLLLDTSKVQKKFDIGEGFNSENLAIRGYFMNGEQFSDDILIIDSREFYLPDGQTRNEPKNHIKIIVEYLGKTYSYYVDIVKPTVRRLYLKEKIKPQNVFVGQTIDEFNLLNHVELHQILSNGEDSVVTEGFTCSIPTGKFVEGNNDITISYHGMETVYHVDAKQRTLLEIRIKNAESIPGNKNLEFNVGTRNINFNDIPDLAFEGKYLDKNPDTSARVGSYWEPVDINNIEFNYSKINLGKNQVTATYGLTGIQTEFDVIGLYKVSEQTVNNFTTFIKENIGLDPQNTTTYDSLTMVERFNILNEGHRLLAEIGFDYKEPQVEIDGVLTDTDFTKARAIYMLKKDEYNKIAQNINTGFNNTLKIGGSMNNALLIAGGFTAFLQIISLIIKSL